jgi:hypothetical protein
LGFDGGEVRTSTVPSTTAIKPWVSRRVRLRLRVRVRLRLRVGIRVWVHATY